MREKFWGAHAPSRVVAGALAGHVFTIYTLDIEPAKRRRLGSAVVPPAAFGVPPNALEVRLPFLREDLRGEVLKLQAGGNHYRLRVGNFRVLFLLADDAIQVYAVKDRKEAYA